MRETEVYRKKRIWKYGMRRICLRKTCFLIAAICICSLSPIRIQAAQTPDVQTAAEQTPENFTSTTLMYAVTRANVRSGPSVSTESLGKLEEGEKIFAVELTEEGWYRVVFQGKTGYVRQDLLAVYTVQAGEDAGEDEESRQWAPGAAQPAEMLPEEIPQEEIPAEELPSEELLPEEIPVDPSQDSVDAGKDKAAVESGKNISTFVILAAVAVIILIYGSMQIIKERRQEDADASHKKAENQAEENDADGIVDMDYPDDAEWTDDGYGGEWAENADSGEWTEDGEKR